MAFGYKQLTQTSGVPVQLSYDGHPEMLGGSITLDWTTVAAVGSPTYLPADELTVAAGQKYLGEGQFLCMITATGLYGPFDPTATDGRQAPAAGKCGLINQTVLQNGILGITAANTDNGNLVIGGRVWQARLIQSGAGPASLAAGPTLATLLAALPRLIPV